LKKWRDAGACWIFKACTPGSSIAVAVIFALSKWGSRNPDSFKRI
jgi:hypothetical protein